jgi:hypothetical protein
MKKGRYYIPLFLIVISNTILSFYIGDALGGLGWATSLLLLSEVYYLRFLK